MRILITSQNWTVVVVISKYLTVDLDSGDGLEEAAKEIRDFAKLLESKVQEVAEKLADVGITVARNSVGDDYASYIVFQKSIVDQKDGECTICMYADNSGDLVRRWGAGHSDTINAVMMNEVGSGWFAENPDGLSGAGQGTFPGQTHAFDPKGWFWTDSTGKHHSYGENGHLSMHKAYIAMQQDIGRIVSEVFG